jgi:N-acetylmuramoyl-L-alanine amidase
MENVLMKFFWTLVLCLAVFPLSPASGKEPLKAVILDPGHGGYDMGIQRRDVREKDVALALAREIKSIFLTVDVDVTLTRKIDHYESISERRSKANELSPDVFVSLHLADGDHFTVYTAWYEKPYTDLDIKEFYAIDSRQRRFTYESERFAKIVAETLRGQIEGRNVFVRKMPLPLISSIGAPAILIEVPSTSLNYAADSDDLFRVASALVLSILRYDEQR